MSRIQLVIKSELPNVSLMAMAVHKFCVFYGMNEIEAYQIELCVSEAATNSILHAYSGRPECEVALTFSLESGSMTLECVDTGKPMSPEQARLVNDRYAPPEPDIPPLLEGGRGLQIIRSIMDEVHYSSDQACNRLTMSKRVKKRPENQ